MDSNDSSLKKCNFCSEEIPAGTGRCPYCGSLLEVLVDEAAFGVVDVKPSEEAPGDMPVVNEAPDADAAEVKENMDKTAYIPGNAGSHPGPSYKGATGFREYKRPPLGNGLKVFLTVIFTLIPGLGQLAGIITAIVFMNTDDDPDRKSFGVAILVASLVMFVLACIGCFIAVIAFSMNQSFGNLPY